MRALKAQVRGGRFVVEEPANLPEGTEVELTLVETEDEFTPEERARLERELDAAQEEYERGEGMDGFEFLAQLRAGR
jgi:hypothetical protein